MPTKRIPTHQRGDVVYWRMLPVFRTKISRMFHVHLSGGLGSSSLVARAMVGAYLQQKQNWK